MENKSLKLIIENVKIDKILCSWRHPFARNYCNCFKNVIIITKRIRRNSFVYCNYKKNSKMKINEHKKKGGKKCECQRKLFHIQVVPNIKNIMEGVHCARGGNILEYLVKKNALSKPRHNHLSSTLTLQGVQTLQHKRKTKISPPLEICNVVQDKKFMVVYKKELMKHAC